eukprot:gene10157-11195_t
MGEVCESFLRRCRVFLSGHTDEFTLRTMQNGEKVVDKRFEKDALIPYGLARLTATGNENCLFNSKSFSPYYDQLLLPKVFGIGDTILKSSVSGFTLAIVHYSMSTNPVSKKVFIPKGEKNAYLRAAGAGKATYSVLFCISANGDICPPFVVYKAKHLYQIWTQGGPTGAAQIDGWMENIAFEEWFLQHYVLWAESFRKPCILFLDGHGSHLTYRVVKACLSALKDIGWSELLFIQRGQSLE